MFLISCEFIPLSLSTVLKIERVSSHSDTLNPPTHIFSEFSCISHSLTLINYLVWLRCFIFSNFVFTSISDLYPLLELQEYKNNKKTYEQISDPTKY